MALGVEHTLLLTRSGDVIVFGVNDDGRLGLGQNSSSKGPARLILGHKIKYIAAARFSSYLVDNLNNVLVFGDNRFGQLGLGDKLDRNSPTKLSLTIIKDINSGDLYEMARKDLGPDLVSITINMIPSIKEIAGANHSIILTEDGKVYMSGNNERGQLGLGHEKNVSDPMLLTLEHRIIQVAAGFLHSILLSDEGRVYVCGDNKFGQLGLGDHDCF